LDLLSSARYGILQIIELPADTFTHQAGVEAAEEVAVGEVAGLMEMHFDASRVTPKWLKQL